MLAAAAASASLVPCLSTVSLAARRPRQRVRTKTKPQKAQSGRGSSSPAGFGGGRTEPVWRCVEGCGACCKLDKGPAFATPEEIFENPRDIELYRSMVGPDGWCIHFEKSTRKCSIYPERPYFCRVNPENFQSLYGIDKKSFDREACASCRDTIKAIYGSKSEELENFNCSVKSSNLVPKVELDHPT
ncbi:uncharacterized protein LOC116207543 [Punica granatum]|uniref:Uncharacterized protein LOC116207543 n=1 Tax=Punica granatum TaxID=22663 RepID=A0A218XC51_PUNGR|nr:uncharacterized protein LOC116207543 [Punica granatum]OWM82358.1 hypothetical protein CDL15_Pgr001932 [Punica granatum]